MKQALCTVAWKLKTSPRRSPQQEYDHRISLGKYDLAERIARDYHLGEELRRRAVILLIAKLQRHGLKKEAAEIKREFFGSTLLASATGISN